MDMYKYVITGEAKEYDGVTVHRIRAATDFLVFKPFQSKGGEEYTATLIREGTLGGWIEKEENLSQHGMAWVADEAIVYGHARVLDQALVYDHAVISDYAHAEGFAQVSGHAKLHGNASVDEFATVGDNADIDAGSIYEYASVYGNARILDGYGCTLIRGHSRIHEYVLIWADCDGDISIEGDAHIHGDVYIHGKRTDCGFSIDGDTDIGGSTVIRCEADVEKCRRKRRGLFGCT